VILFDLKALSLDCIKLYLLKVLGNMLSQYRLAEGPSINISSCNGILGSRLRKT
jgi:hypothetical protein